MAFREVVMVFCASVTKQEILKRKYERKTDELKARWAATVFMISFFNFSLGSTEFLNSHIIPLWLYFFCQLSLTMTFFISSSSVSNFWNRIWYWKTSFSFKWNNGRWLLSSLDNLSYTFKRQQSSEFSAKCQSSFRSTENCSQKR